MVAAADLVAFASAGMPDSDSGSSGGAIDDKRRIDFVQIAANDTITAISDNAADTQNLTIEGRNAAGSLVSETKALTGTTGIDFGSLGTVERVIKAELASDATGIITVERGTAASPGDDLRTIPATERGFLAFLRKGASDPSVTVDYYLKFFWMNTHGSQALTNAVVKQNAESASPERVTHALATTKDDTGSVTDRTTDHGLSPDDDADKDVPEAGQQLLAGEAIGVWLHVSLPSGDTAHRETYTSELTGESV